MVLYIHATIVTVNPSRDVILDGAILVKDDRIAAIGKAGALLEKYMDENTVDLTGRIIIPGLISTHMHTAQTLLRGQFRLIHVTAHGFRLMWGIGAADDLELVSWLCERIWVLQGNFTAEDGYAAARISIAEMLLTGTTCFLESMVTFLVNNTSRRSY
jgi:cytosine/adenosine deaminase-related metal-dependent hydrolase